MMVWRVFALALVGARAIVGSENTSNITSKDLDICSGLKLVLYDDELRVKLNLDKIFDVTAVQGRTHHEEEKKPGPLERFGPMMMMIPLVLQMLTLPGAIASIKMSLLKSLVVGKIALLLMLFNMLRTQPKNEIVVVHQSVPNSHSHYYPYYHQEKEDDDKGWFG